MRDALAPAEVWVSVETGDASGAGEGVCAVANGVFRIRR